jgi:hypothetical protein
MARPNEVVHFPNEPKGYRVEFCEADLDDLRFGIARARHVGAVPLEIKVDGRWECLEFLHILLLKLWGAKESTANRVMCDRVI